MTPGRLVIEDVREVARPAARCRSCGGAMGGLRLEPGGTFVHSDPQSCRARRPTVGRLDRTAVTLNYRR